MYPFATYLISIDTASGEGLDGTAINLIDPIDYHIVASLNNNRLDGPDLKELIMELMQVWFKESINHRRSSNCSIYLTGSDQNYRTSNEEHLNI